MNHTIFAWTGPTPPEGYPAFVNISRDEQGNHTVAVRSQGNGGRDTAVAEIPVEALESLLCDLAADLYRDDTSGVQGLDGQALSGETLMDSVSRIPASSALTSSDSTVNGEATPASSEPDEKTSAGLSRLNGGQE